MTDNATIKVRQIKSPIGRPLRQKRTLIGLGLNKINRVCELQKTPEILGMIKKVRHLVEIQDY